MCRVLDNSNQIFSEQNNSGLMYFSRLQKNVTFRSGSMMNHPYIQLIEKKIPVIFDGAFGTQIQKSNISVEKFLTAPGCNEILNITCPKISAIHTVSGRANVIGQLIWCSRLNSVIWITGKGL